MTGTQTQQAMLAAAAADGASNPFAEVDVNSTPLPAAQRDFLSPNLKSVAPPGTSSAPVEQPNTPRKTKTVDVSDAPTTGSEARFYPLAIQEVETAWMQFIRLGDKAYTDAIAGEYFNTHPQQRDFWEVPFFSPLTYRTVLFRNSLFDRCSLIAEKSVLFF